MSEQRRMNLYSLPVPRDVSSFAPLKHAVKLMMIGHCDAEFGLDVLRVAARDRNIDLDVVLGHMEDPQLEEQVSREKPQIVVVTVLTAKYELMAGENVKPGRDALAADTPYVAAARTALERLRRVTQAPVLLHNLQVPVVTPLGRADRGIASHKTRVALTNVQLEALALEFPDSSSSMSRARSRSTASAAWSTIRDGSFHHFGSLRWITQTPESFKRDVHGIAPPWSQLAEAFGGGDVAEYDRIIANEQLDILVSALALEPRTCVVVELDGTLWPGVLAETGSPFALDSPPGHFLEELGAWGYAGLYRGIHEALKALKNRGILLACVSRNDEDVVKQLWRYPEALRRNNADVAGFRHLSHQPGRNSRQHLVDRQGAEPAPLIVCVRGRQPAGARKGRAVPAGCARHRRQPVCDSLGVADRRVAAAGDDQRRRAADPEANRTEQSRQGHRADEGVEGRRRR